MSIFLPIFSIIIIFLFELVAAILASIHFKKYNKTTEKYFLYFLWYTVLTELISIITGWIFKQNLIEIFIIYDVVTFSFLIYWYSSILTKKINKQILFISAFVFISIAVYDLVFQDWETTNKFTFICGAVITIIGALLFFSEILKSNLVLNLKSELRFWIATGLLLFNVGFVPIEIFKDIFNANNEVGSIIKICLNLILYTCYSVGFIWVKKKNS